MHEYGITMQIIKIAQESAKENNSKKVTDISLVVGEMSGFIGDSIQLYFDEICKGTITEGAKLHIKNVKPLLYCPKCNKNFLRERFSFECPTCGSSGEITDIGKEFYVESIEVL